MTSAPRGPTTDELLAMAYADGELSAGARREFETRLAHEAPLRALVADQRRIAVLAREAAPPEPLELAALSFEKRVASALYLLGGRAFLLLGALWLLTWIALASVEGAWRPPLAGAALLAAAGVGLLLLRARATRRATLHLDPYRDVRR